MELCVDQVYNGLCDEVKQLNFAQHQLNENIRRVKISYNELNMNLIKLESELHKKQHTLSIDIRAIDSRQRLKLDSIKKSTVESRSVSLENLHLH